LVGVDPDIIIVGFVDLEFTTTAPRLLRSRDITAPSITGTARHLETSVAADVGPIPPLRDATATTDPYLRTTLASSAIGVGLARIEYTTSTAITFRTDPAIGTSDPMGPGIGVCVGITILTGVGWVGLGMERADVVDQAVGKVTRVLAGVVRRTRINGTYQTVIAIRMGAAFRWIATILTTATGVLAVGTAVSVTTGRMPAIGWAVAGIFVPVGIADPIVTDRRCSDTVSSAVTGVVYRGDVKVITARRIVRIDTAQIVIAGVVGTYVAIVTFHRYITSTGTGRADVSRRTGITVVTIQRVIRVGTGVIPMADVVGADVAITTGVRHAGTGPTRANICVRTQIVIVTG